MKKIMFYTGGIGLGGVERVLLNILSSLDKKKFDIKLGLQYEDENIFEDEIPKSVNYEYMLSKDIIKKTLGIKKNKKNLFYKLYYSFLLKKERKIIKKNYLEFSKDRDVIIDFKNSDYARVTSQETNSKRICWYHGSVKTTNTYKKKPKKHRKNLNKYHKIIVICNDMKKEMVEMFPELENRIKKIYNPFDFERIRKMADHSLDLTKDEKKMLNQKYIVAVSRLDYIPKGYPTLLKAFRLAKNNGLKEKLYIVGEGPDRIKIQDKIKELNLEEEVILLGLQKNPYVWIKNAELFIHSSKNEGLPTVLIEALILDTPIISTDCPVGPREILEDGKSGALVEVGNSEEMALKLNELIIDVKLREKYVDNANKSIERFNSKQIKIQIEKLLEEI